MFIDSYLRACRILRFMKKLDFPFVSLGGPRHGAQVWCLGRVPKHRKITMASMLWHSAETPNPGTMALSAQTQEGKIVWADQAMVPGFGVSAECQSIDRKSTRLNSSLSSPSRMPSSA